MNKINNCLILVILAFAALSCGRKVECPDFDENVYEWFPYAKNDTIILERETKDTSIALFTESTLIWHTTHYMTNLDCGTCWDEITIGNYDSKISNLYIFVRLDKNQINSEEYYIKGSYFGNTRSNYYKQDNYSFGGTVYPEVKIFENAVSDEFYTQLIIAKYYGIIGLVDKNGIKWIRSRDYVLKIVHMEIRNKACE